MAVFEAEKKREHSKPFEGGGSNKTFLSESTNGLDKYQNSMYMFNDKIENFVDPLKFYIFNIQYWVSLATICITGTRRFDVFSLGYISGAFIFLWYGTEFYTKPLETIVRWWDVLLTYNVWVIVLKVMIKIFICRFGEKIPLEYCWIANMFDLPCAKLKTSDFCIMMEKEPPYLYDGFAFVLIIFQRRIFLSYYFLNVVGETLKVTSVLASRFVD